MNVSIFVTIKSDASGINSNAFTSRVQAIKSLTKDHADKVKKCGGIDEFFDAVNSGHFDDIHVMEINELRFDLRTLISAAENETKPDKSPYLFSIKETINGNESSSVQLAYTNNPETMAMQMVLSRLTEPADWDDELQGVSLGQGASIVCTDYQSITHAQAMLWEMADKMQYLPEKGGSDG